MKFDTEFYRDCAKAFVGTIFTIAAFLFIYGQAQHDSTMVNFSPIFLIVGVVSMYAFSFAFGPWVKKGRHKPEEIEHL